MERVISHLTRIAKARPRKRKTLASNIAAGKLLIDEKETVTYRL